MIDWQIRRHENLHNHTTPSPQQPLIPTTLSIQRPSQLPLPTSVQNPSAIPKEMPINRTERPRQPAESRAYWQPNQPVGAAARYFRQIRYFTRPNALPELDKTLSEASVDCGQDV